MTSIRKSHDYNRICLSFAGGYYPPSLSGHNWYVSIMRVCWPLWWLATNVSILWAKDSCIPVESQSLIMKVQVFFFLLSVYFAAILKLWLNPVKSSQWKNVILISICQTSLLVGLGAVILPYKYHCALSLFLYSPLPLSLNPYSCLVIFGKAGSLFIYMFLCDD